MSVTKDDIIEWFQEGIKNNFKYMIVACDTFDWDDYPIYCKDEQEFEREYQNVNFVNMQKPMETYDLTLDMISQVNTRRNHIRIEIPLMKNPNVLL